MRVKTKINDGCGNMDLNSKELGAALARSGKASDYHVDNGHEPMAKLPAVKKAGQMLGTMSDEEK